MEALWHLAEPEVSHLIFSATNRRTMLTAWAFVAVHLPYPETATSHRPGQKYCPSASAFAKDRCLAMTITIGDDQSLTGKWHQQD